MVMTNVGSDSDAVSGVGAGCLALPDDLNHLSSAQSEELGHWVHEKDLGQL